MQTRFKLVLTALVSTIILTMAVGAASARRIEFSNTGIRAVWRALTFSTETGGRGPEIACPLTIEGTFHSRTIAKVSGQLIGYITRAILGAQTTPPCTYVNGVSRVEILAASLPWHVRYDRFIGVLPRIERIRLQLIGVTFLITAIGASCLYKSTAARPLFGNAGWKSEGGGSTGESTFLEVESSSEILLFEGSFLCPGGTIFRGNSEPVTLLGTTTIIRIRLVA